MKSYSSRVPRLFGLSMLVCSGAFAILAAGCIEVGHPAEIGCMVDFNEPGCSASLTSPNYLVGGDGSGGSAADAGDTMDSSSDGGEGGHS